MGRKGEVSEGWRIAGLVDCPNNFGMGISVDPCFRWVVMVGACFYMRLSY